MNCTHCNGHGNAAKDPATAYQACQVCKPDRGITFLAWLCGKSEQRGKLKAPAAKPAPIAGAPVYVLFNLEGPCYAPCADKDQAAAVLRWLAFRNKQRPMLGPAKNVRISEAPPKDKPGLCDMPELATWAAGVHYKIGHKLDHETGRQVPFDEAIEPRVMELARAA